MTRSLKYQIYQEFKMFDQCKSERDFECRFHSVSGFLRALALNDLIKWCVYESLYNILRNIYVDRCIFSEWGEIV